MSNLIEIRRRRIVIAKLDSMQRKTGNHYAVINLPNDEVATIQLNETILTKALIKIFEAMVFD